jgi:hypothetical protein
MSTHILSLNNSVVQKKGNLVSDMDGSKVMLSIEQGKYYNLGSIGGDIWDLIESRTKVYSIVNQLLGQYEVEEEVCKEQVLAFISQLLKADLVEVNQ